MRGFISLKGNSTRWKFRSIAKNEEVQEIVNLWVNILKCIFSPLNFVKDIWLTKAKIRTLDCEVYNYGTIYMTTTSQRTGGR